ncbi:MAG: NAD-dependent epimerase/dehydratase family protein [Myxococcota bacterium]
MTDAAPLAPLGGQTIAVAGGSGFIGRHVVDVLARAGAQVVVIGRSQPDAGERRAAVSFRTADVGAAAPDLSGCDAVVNLVGIKAPQGDNTFARAHVDAVRHLVEAMERSGVRRLVHVSVVALPDSLGPYAKTKREGEAAAAGSGLDTTILRPALVVGPGDDALTNLIRFTRAAPVFPVASGPSGLLSPVDVRDVAAAVGNALARPDTAGETIDVVGPEAMDFRALLARVSGALSLRTLALPIPAFTQRWAAAVLERVVGPSIVTRSQLAMLSHGLTGDSEAAAERLGLQPRPLTDATIRRCAEEVRDLVPSVRIAPSPAHQRWLVDRADAWSALRWLVPIALLLMLAAPALIPNVWIRMAVLEAALAAAVLAGVPALRWRASWSLSPRTIGLGLLAAAALYVACGLGFAALGRLAPALASRAAEIYAWPTTLSVAAQLPLLVVTVAAEDIVWRAAVGIPLAARLGPLAGVLVAGTLFAAAHVTSGPPILWLAALVCGALWTALLIRTRSVAATVVCHLSWDVTVIYLLPYG